LRRSLTEVRHAECHVVDLLDLHPPLPGLRRDVGRAIMRYSARFRRTPP
jgi:hypothetical protein